MAIIVKSWKRNTRKKMILFTEKVCCKLCGPLLLNKSKECFGEYVILFNALWIINFKCTKNAWDAKRKTILTLSTKCKTLTKKTYKFWISEINRPLSIIIFLYFIEIEYKIIISILLGLIRKPYSKKLSQKALVQICNYY